MKKWNKPEMLNLEIADTKAPTHYHCDNCGYVGLAEDLDIGGGFWVCPKCKSQVFGGICNKDDMPSQS